MTRCPSCRTDVGDRRVCPECSTSIDGRRADRRDSPGSASASQHQSGNGRGQPAGGPNGTGPGQPTDGPSGTGLGGQNSHAPARTVTRPFPTGLKFVCGLLVVSGLVSFGVGTQLQSVGSTAAGYGVEQGGAVETLGVVVLGIGLGQIAAGAGLWTRKSWGWTATMAVTGAGALSGLALLSNGFTTTTGLVTLLVNGGIGWYVYRQRWRFRNGAGAQRQSRQPNTPSRRGSHATRGTGNRDRNG